MSFMEEPSLSELFSKRLNLLLAVVAISSLASWFTVAWVLGEEETKNAGEIRTWVLGEQL